MDRVTSSTCTEGEKDHSDVYGKQETQFGNHTTVSFRDASKNNTIEKERLEEVKLTGIICFLPHSLDYIQWGMIIPLSNFKSAHRFISTQSLCLPPQDFQKDNMECRGVYACRI